MDGRFCSRKRPPEVSDYLKLRNAAGWDAVPEDVSAAALKKIIVFCVIVARGEVVGMGRVIGDDDLYLYIQDVMELPEHQCQGIGSWIMDLITAYMDENQCKEAFVGLKSAPGLEYFYGRYGFTSKPEDVPACLW